MKVCTHIIITIWLLAVNKLRFEIFNSDFHSWLTHKCRPVACDTLRFIFTGRGLKVQTKHYLSIDEDLIPTWSHGIMRIGDNKQRCIWRVFISLNGKDVQKRHSTLPTLKRLLVRLHCYQKSNTRWEHYWSSSQPITRYITVLHENNNPSDNGFVVTRHW